jgi:hypothetical protein
MRTAFSVFFAFCSLTVFSQTDSANRTSTHKINIGLCITPEFNNLTVDNPVGQETVKSEIGFSVGLNLEFHIAKNASIRTGIGYGKKNYNHTQNGLIFGTDIDPHTGVVSESKIESKISFSEIQIPLLFQYELKEHKFFVAGGIEMIYPFSNNSERIIYYGNGNTEKISNPKTNSLNFAPVLSIGYKLPVSDKLSVSVEPMFKYYLKEYVIIASHLYNYGLKVTFNFGL